MINPKESEFQMRCLYLTLARTRNEEEDSATVFIRIPSYMELPDLKEQNTKICKDLFGDIKLENEWGEGSEKHSIYSVKYEHGLLEFMNSLYANIKPAYKELLGPEGAIEWLRLIKECEPNHDLTHQIDPGAIPNEEIKTELLKATKKNPDIPEQDLIKALKIKKAERKAEFALAKSLSIWLAKIILPMQYPYVINNTDSEFWKSLKAIACLGDEDFSKELKKWGDLGVLGAVAFQPSPFPIRKNLRLSMEEGSLKIHFPWTVGINGTPLLDNLCSYFRTHFKALEYDSKNKNIYAGDPHGLKTMWTRELTIKDNTKNLNLLYPYIEAGINGLLSTQVVKNKKTQSFMSKLGQTHLSDEVIKKTVQKLGDQVLPQPYETFLKKKIDITQEQKKTMVIEDRIVPYPNKSFIYIQATKETGDLIKDAVENFLSERPDTKGAMEFMNRDQYWRCSIAEYTEHSNKMETYEDRINYAKVLSKSISDYCGIKMPIQSPNINSIEAYIAGVPGKFDSKVLKIKVPKSMNDDALDDYENGDKKISKDSQSLYEFEEYLDSNRIQIGGKKLKWKREDKDMTTIYFVSLPNDRKDELAQEAVDILKDEIKNINEKNKTSLSMAFVNKKNAERNKLEKILKSNISSWKKTSERHQQKESKNPENSPNTYELLASGFFN